MPARFLGAHMPAKGGIHNAILGGHAIGCTAVQVFTSSPQMWKAKELSEEGVEAFRTACRETGIGDKVVSHDSYLVNMAAPDDGLRRKSIDALKAEIRRCEAYGIPYVVSHMGAHMGLGADAGLSRVADGAREVLAETGPGVTLLMETTAGQGSSLNSRFEEIATVFDLLGPTDRLAVCIDTCHLFAAGYDLRTPEAYEATFSEFDRLIGIQKIRCVHANDSKKPLGSRVDRHEAIGMGELGEECFRLLVNDPRFDDIIIVIETPDAETMHAVNLSKLMAMRQAGESCPAGASTAL